MSPVSTQTSFDDVYLYALRGDVLGALDLLDHFPEHRLTPEQRREKQRFLRRFRSLKDGTFTGECPLVDRVLTFFRGYWEEVLLEKADRDQGLNGLLLRALPYLYDNYLKASGVTMEALQGDAASYLGDLLRERGYYSAIGYTGRLMDLYLWKDQERQTFCVDLPETVVEVSVVFLKDVVSMGWQDYATLGKHSPGGWAGGSELYCPLYKYDLQSEYFRVNFLTHEAQHFADYRAFPRLEQVDLEYRAKLAELSRAEQTVYDILSRFLGDTSKSADDPHAFPNLCLMRALSRMIFQEDWVADVSRWQEIPVQTIREAALRLFGEHSEQLQQAGSQEVTRLIA